MLEEAREGSDLTAIKNHLDTHGMGSVIFEDHVAFGVGMGKGLQKIVRVRSLEEACGAIGCSCGHAR